MHCHKKWGGREEGGDKGVGGGRTKEGESERGEGEGEEEEGIYQSSLAGGGAGVCPVMVCTHTFPYLTNGERSVK